MSSLIKDKAPDDRSMQIFQAEFKGLISSQEQIETLFDNIRDHAVSEKMTIILDQKCQAHFL